MKEGTRKQIRKAAIILFWLVVWQVAAVWTDNQILLVGPLQVLRALAENVMRSDFFVSVVCSFVRIGLGFFLAFFAGLLLGAVGCRFPLAEDLMAPVMSALKSIPVASFVVLLLIWFGSDRLSLCISFLIVLPNVYVNTAAGLRSTDEKLLEMARVFGIGGRRKFLYLYRPALMPYLNSSLRISLGMSWKSGVAAEIIGLPEHSLGEKLYLSKIYLDTAGLFAWTLTIVLISFLFERAVLRLVKAFEEWRPYPASGAGIILQKERTVSGTESGVKETISGTGNRTEKTAVGTESADRAENRKKEIQILHIEKAYNGHAVLRDFNLTIKEGERYLLMAPSGAGKTTLLKIITGLERADRGTVTGMPVRVGMVFQEDRLCEGYDAICNIMLGMEEKACRRMRKGELVAYVREQAAMILPEDCLTEPVRNLSGGMRRRVALLRAVLSGADFLILDEPFNGLDEDNRMRSAVYLTDHLDGKCFLATTHREEDARLLQGTEIGIG